MHTYTYIYVATHRVKYSQTDGQTHFNVVPKNFSGFSRNSPTVSSYAVKICMYVCIYVRGWSDKCLVSPTDGATNENREIYYYVGESSSEFCCDCDWKRARLPILEKCWKKLSVGDSILIFGRKTNSAWMLYTVTLRLVCWPPKIGWQVQSGDMLIFDGAPLNATLTTTTEYYVTKVNDISLKTTSCLLCMKYWAWASCWCVEWRDCSFRNTNATVRLLHCSIRPCLSAIWSSFWIVSWPLTKTKY